MNFPSPMVGRPAWLRSAMLVALAAALSGCGKEETKVYRVAKEQPAPPPAANPHSASAANPHGAAGALPQIKWKQLPAGWEEKPAGNMRVASFNVAGKEGQAADVSVIPLPGADAQQMDMVNMWRSQLQLQPAAAEESAKLAEEVQIGSEKGKLFDLASTGKIIDGKATGRIVAAILTRGDTAWFFKMMGEDSLVAGQKAAFKDFLKSLEFVSSPAAGGIARAMPAMGGVAPTGSGAAPAKPSWTVPAGWKEEPPTQMLIAKFVAGDPDAKAEITVSAFPGDVGGLLANVNRWRRQIGLAPIADADLPKAVGEIEVQGGKASLVELDGADPKSGKKAKLVGVIIPQATQTWFYKMLGDGAVVSREKDALVKFAQSAK